MKRAFPMIGMMLIATGAFAAIHIPTPTVSVTTATAPATTTATAPYGMRAAATRAAATVPAGATTKSKVNGVILPLRSCAGLEALIATIPDDLYPTNIKTVPEFQAYTTKVDAWSDANIAGKPIDIHEVSDLLAKPDSNANGYSAKFVMPSGVEVSLTVTGKADNGIATRIGFSGGASKVRQINLAIKIP